MGLRQRPGVYYPVEHASGPSRGGKATTRSNPATPTKATAAISLVSNLGSSGRRSDRHEYGGSAMTACSGFLAMSRLFRNCVAVYLWRPAKGFPYFEGSDQSQGQKRSQGTPPW